MANYPNPYVGPSPFEQEDWPRFFGRNDEASELFSLTCAHSVVLFYSQSGAGKTSLINAGVIPKLNTEQFKVFPVARVGVQLPKDVNVTQIDNVFLFNTLLSLEGKKKQRNLKDLGKMSLADYLREQISNGRRKYVEPLRVLFFDQFEELFTSFPEEWSKRDRFFINISEALERDPLLRVVFAMREEYIAELEPFAPMLPLRLQKRFRLERLRKDAAKKAIEGPVKDTERSYAKHVADGLVNNLLQQQIKQTGGSRTARPTLGEFVEPVQLQIVCRSLWEELPEKVKVIDERAISEFGDVDAALARYYSNCLRKIVKKYPDVNEGKLRLWFQESLITPVKTRATAYVDEGSTAGLSDQVIAMLEEQRLMRPELRGGAKWYELTHDRFIEPILQSNQQWYEGLSEGGSFIYELEQKAISWDKAGRKAEELLTGDVVQKFRNTAKYSSDLTKISPSKHLEDYVNASETAAVKRKSREFRNQVVIYVIVGVIVVGLIVYSIVSTAMIRQANRATQAIQAEKGKLAKEYAAVSGREINGLVLGLEAAALSDPDDAPAEMVDGLRAALAAVDRKVWLRYTIGSASRAERLQLSADGRLALTVNNTELCIWDALTGQRAFNHCIARDEGGMWGKAQFLPDSKLVYAVVKPLLLTGKQESTSRRAGQGSEDTSVTALKESFVWVVDTRTGESTKQLQGLDNFQISNDSQHVLADFGTGGVQIIDVRDGSRRTPSSRENQNLWYQMALSPDGSRLVAVYGGTKVDLLATDSDQIRSFDVGIQKTSAIDQISFSPDGKYGALVRLSLEGKGDAAGLVWENSSGNPVASFKTKARNADYVAFSSDSARLLVSDKKIIEVINTRSGTLELSREVPEQTVVLHAGFNTLFLQNEKGTCTISVFDGQTEPSPRYTYVTKSEISMAATTASGNRVIVVDEDKTIQIWSLVAPLAIDDLNVEQLITEGCKKLLDRKTDFPQIEPLCKPRVQSW